MKIDSIAVVLLSLLFSFSLQAGPVIHSFDSYITVGSDSQLLIEEKINITTEGQIIQRGIYRDIPTRYKTPYGEVVVAFRVKNASIDGTPTSFFSNNLSNGVRIYIGDKYKYLAPGRYVFTLTYSVSGELGYFTDHDELYWNVTGNGWDFPILEARATVKLPKGAFQYITGNKAYTGVQGSREQNYQTVINDKNESVLFKTTQALAPHQGLTIVLGWKKGFVTPPSFLQQKNNVLLLIVLIGLVFIFIYYYWAWGKYGVDHRSRVVIPQYEPPSGYTPAQLRFVVNMGYDSKILSSSILNLAVMGYLKIIENGQSYTLLKQLDFSGILAEEEKILASTLFATRDLVELKQFAGHEALETNFSANLDTKFKGTYFVTNIKYTLIGMGLSLLPFALLILLNINLWVSVMMLSFFFVIPLVLVALPSATLKQKIKMMLGTVFYSGFLMVFVYFDGLPVFAAKTGLYCVLFFILAIINIVFALLLKRPTEIGQRLIEQAKGFKLFLNATEKDRLNFHNPPDRTPQLFERFLPYALALGVEQHWAEQFSEQLAEVGYQPKWYVGSGITAFNAAAFSTSINNNLSLAISSATSAPGSSSGFSRSGSSGGGGGGGGGGGW